MRTVLLIGIGILYLLSVPWYRSADSEVAIVGGLPDWVAVAIACYAAVAVLNAVLWLITDVPDASATGETRAPEAQNSGDPDAGAREPRE